MSLPEHPTDSIQLLPESFRKGISLTRDKFEKTVSWLPEKGCRMSLFHDGAVAPLLRFIEEQEEGRRPTVSVADAGSLLIRAKKPADFLSRFGENKVRKIGPDLFRFDFAKVGGEFARYAESPNPIAEFEAFALDHDVGVDQVGWNHFIFIPEPENHGDCQATDQWPIDDLPGVPGNISAAMAHHETRGRPEVVVAVLDTAINHAHRDLEGASILPRCDALGFGDLPNEDRSHGTMCVGVIVAQKKLRFLGVAPGCTVLPVRIIGPSTISLVDRAIAGIRCARDQNARIVSMSFEVTGNSQCLRTEMTAHEDMLFVAAAGNAHRNLVLEPAFPGSFELKNLISVVSCSREGRLGSGSSYAKDSERAHIAGPGEIVCFCDGETPDDYDTSTSTSIATPHVSGVCALAWSMACDADALTIKGFVLGSAVELNGLRDKCLTNGRVDAARAVALAAGRALPPSPPPPPP
jgi:hypothetical protein